jgi:hypothetical protein
MVDRPVQIRGTVAVEADNYDGLLDVARVLLAELVGPERLAERPAYLVLEDAQLNISGTVWVAEARFVWPDDPAF